jgi:hypothetical protein
MQDDLAAGRRDSNPRTLVKELLARMKRHRTGRIAGDSNAVGKRARGNDRVGDVGTRDGRAYFVKQRASRSAGRRHPSRGHASHNDERRGDYREDHSARQESAACNGSHFRQ